MKNIRSPVVSQLLEGYEYNTSKFEADEKFSNGSVLGKLVGVFFKLDSVSTNGRAYSGEFWRKVISSNQVKERLRTGQMIGTFEHPTVRSKFNQLGDFTPSHPIYGAFVVKKLWIKGNVGYGEAYILNTPMGNLLSTYLKATDENGKPLVEINISSRGFTRKDYIGRDGYDHMNPNDYFLESFDVTLTPGIKGARVKMESELEDFSVGKFESIENSLEKAMMEIEKTCTLECTKKLLKYKLGLKNV